MNTLRSIAARIRAKTGQLVPTAGAVLVNAPLTAEQWESMLDLEVRLLARQGNGETLDEQATDFLRWMPWLRADRQRPAEADKPFVPEFGIDVKVELAKAEADAEAEREETETP